MVRCMVPIIIYPILFLDLNTGKFKKRQVFSNLKKVRVLLRALRSGRFIQKIQEKFG